MKFHIPYANKKARLKTMQQIDPELLHLFVCKVPEKLYNNVLVRSWQYILSSKHAPI